MPTPPTDVDETRPHTDWVVLGMGCFWGAEQRMASLPGVVDVESGYASGEVPGTCAEVVRVRFDTSHTTLAAVLVAFWENHDPTQGDRQGNDIGSTYRSAIYTHDAAGLALAEASRDAYQAALTATGYGTITTEIAPLARYIAAEDEHQDYLVKNPDGYCGLGGTGVKFPFDRDQRRIAFEKGTEPAFTSPHLDEMRPGTFIDPISGAALFRTDTKFDSGSGWPSFFSPLPGAITLHEDRSHGMVRTEVRSASSGIHLGHVFGDGPPPTGKRYCINGKVLGFVPDVGHGTSDPASKKEL